ncbi:hypothetical protein F5Y16DRAFT_154986 [Xylariaceae sp. FL0255]|nr:hypothetical protein F5Y16DRAFT_154986 [Xylariaceae sp. FL0255]
MAKFSVASVNNENNIALINVSLDFSLLKCDAKPEFQPIGPALTVQRREEAESGPIHRTACTLGFLFNDVLPDTPSLFKAYGRRVSEIIVQPNVNPPGTASDGPFQSFVGADCTSIWAAATSSDASIAVHLLACVLARAFDSKSATSIWFEIVEERKHQIEKLVKDNKMVHPNTYLASKQIVSRSDLAAWDTSARAWLRRADEFKAWEKNQFSLIVENVSLPYTATGTTYSKVVTTWTKSMIVLNNLLENLPQQASDRAVLLAISSWHLYPNLLVFQNKATNVDFKDKLFPPSAVLSLGLEYQMLKGNRDIHWSLALSHLRYYGDPVSVRSNEELSRVTMSQFWLVALGSLFGLWGLIASDITDTIKWLRALGNTIETTASTDDINVSWILSFCSAAKTFLEGGDRLFNSNLQLVKFGWRRATCLFGIRRCLQKPFFGLLNPHILKSLNTSDQISKGFTYLRGLTSRIASEEKQVLGSLRVKIGGSIFYEWATMHSIHDPLLHGSNRARHHRWIHREMTLDPSRWEQISSNQHYLLKQRHKTITAAGEECHILLDLDSTPRPHQMYAAAKFHLMIWPKPPKILGFEREYQFLREIPFDLSCEREHAGYSVWLTEDGPIDKATDHIEFASAERTTYQESLVILEKQLEPREVVEYLRSIVSPPDIPHSSTRRKREYDEIEGTDLMDTLPKVIESNAAYTLMTRETRLSRDFLQSILALQIATLLYEQLPRATVSPRLVDLELHKSGWLPHELTDAEIPGSMDLSWMAGISASKLLQRMTRSEAFGCIAMFESGRSSIKKEHLGDVLALCSEDSIFVAGIMLSDPAASSTSGPQIRHLVGSIGQAGLVFLVSPLNPRIRPIGYNPNSVCHNQYDGKREDKFESVSLHLSFTEWKMPLDWEGTGEIDQEVFLLESVLSVMDSGQWIGDLNVLALEKNPIHVFETECKGLCESGDRGTEKIHAGELISLDTWEELLDLPPSVGVFRSRSNWVARLAAASILCQQKKVDSAIVIGGQEFCWNCLMRCYGPHLPQVIID